MSEKNKILLIEDDEYVSKAYRYFLLKAGFKVDFARSASEAKRKMKTRLPDLILLDLIMPGMNGFEFLEHLREKKISENLPVIIISNLGQEADIQECKRLGAADYLVKSNFFMKDVIEKVKFHLKKFQQE